MRLTLTCLARKRFYRDKTIWRYKDLWKKKGKIKVVQPVIPAVLKDQGIEPIDARVYTQIPVVNLPPWTPPVEDDPKWKPPSTVPQDPRFHREIMSPIMEKYRRDVIEKKDAEMKRHPDYKEQAVYRFHKDVFLQLGEDQAIVMTKSKAYSGLPQTIQNQIGAISIPDQDTLCQRVIMQAHMWDNTRVLLPRRDKPSEPLSFPDKVPMEHWIPPDKTTNLLLDGLVRLCWGLGGRYGDILRSRHLLRDAGARATFEHQDGRTVQIEGEYSWAALSQRPLPAFAQDDEIDNTVGETLPDLFPVLPTIDFERVHIWRHENLLGLKNDLGFSYPHLLVVPYTDTWDATTRRARGPHNMVRPNPDDWGRSQRRAKSILFSFAYCMSLARRLHGENVQTLPEPITTQCISSNGLYFDFICFQLNTLNLTSPDGIKNCVWIDPSNNLVRKLVPPTDVIWRSRFEDYDPAVFQKMLAMFLHGTELTEHREMDRNFLERNRAQ